MRHRHAGQELAKNCVDFPAPAVSRVSLFQKGGASRDKFPSSGELAAWGRFRKRGYWHGLKIDDKIIAQNPGAEIGSRFFRGI